MEFEQFAMSFDPASLKLTFFASSVPETFIQLELRVLTSNNSLRSSINYIIEVNPNTLPDFRTTFNQTITLPCSLDKNWFFELPETFDNDGD